MRKAFTLVLALSFLCGVGFAQDQEQRPRLLLTAQRLRRLQRDKTRHTVRWVNFENRVESVPDSPERGFELALYYAVTRDETRGREAVEWGTAHPCELRQVALIRDWVPEFAAQHAWNSPGNCGSKTLPLEHLRDRYFDAVTAGTAEQDPSLPAGLNTQVLGASGQLYALCEYLLAVRAVTRTDLRQNDLPFFRALPEEFLLSLQPEKVENPDWMTHIAALALVAVDPNLSSAQYLQGWAMEDRQMVRDGPGVAYEFLWADPYMPAIAYQNLDPWTYDPAGYLFARADWTAGSCWIAISPTAVQEHQCPQGWRNQTVRFGKLNLLPANGACTELPAASVNAETIVWKLAPGQALTLRSVKSHSIEHADAAGMWRSSVEATGKLCTNK